MAKQFKITFKNSEQIVIVTAHHFEEDVGGAEMNFFKDEKQKDKDIYVRLDSVAAVVPFEVKKAPTSHSVSS
jgi:hypothetical protein